MNHVSCLLRYWCTGGRPTRHHNRKLKRASIRLLARAQLTVIAVVLLLAGGVLLAAAWSPPDLLLTRRAWVTTAVVLCVPPTTATAAVPSAEGIWATQAGRHGCTTVADPAKTVVTCTGDVLSLPFDSTTTPPPRLSSIAATENGVSTSAIRNPAAYMAPWSYLPETSNANTAWESLMAALQQQQSPPLQLDRDVRTDTYYYLHATIPTPQQPPGSGGVMLVDDVEFVLRPDENLVLFRSASRTSIFVYPLLQPVSDRQSHRKRLQALRQRLGWSELS